MKKFYLLLIAIFTINIANAQWQQTSCGGGNTQAFAVSGSNIFAGTGNGVYLSSNNGNSWTALNNGLTTNLNTYSIAISGTNIYAGKDNGVFKSINNGTTWTAMNTGLTDTNIYSLAISGSNIFAGAGLGVFLSTNNGTNWTAVNNGITILETSLTVLAVNGTNIFVGKYGHGVFLSTNNGTSWTAINNGLSNLNITSLAISGTNIFAGTYGGGVFLSNDNGVSWTAVNNGLTNLYINSFSVSGTIIFAGSNGGGVFLSTNNGSSWTAVNNGLTSTYIYSLELFGTNIFAGSDNGVWKRPLSDFTQLQDTIITSSNPSIGGTTNGSGIFTLNQSCTIKAIPNTGYTFVNWTENGNIVSTDTSYTFTVTASKNLVANFTQNNQNGQWQQTSLNSKFVASLAVSGNNIFAGTYGDGVFLSLNNGNSWTAVNSGLTNQFVNALTISGINIFAGTNDGVFLSTNNGNYWSADGIELYGVYAFLISGNNIYAGTTNIYISNNNGNSWSTSNLAQNEIYSFVINEGKFYAGTNGGIYMSSDNGYSWSAFNSGIPTNTCVRSLAVSGNNIFAGTGGVCAANGVYLLTENNTSWTEVNTGLTNKSVNALATSGNNIFAGTKGGVFWSTNNGNSWAAINVGLTDTNIYSLAISEGFIFAGTNSEGVFKLQFIDTITTSANPTISGATSGGGTFTNNQSCTVKATPNTGYSFLDWTENGNIVSTDTSYTFVVTSNRNLVANFIQNTVQYSITTSANPTNGGTTSGGGTFTNNQSCSVKAIANTGYSFLDWTENGNIISTDTSYTFTVTTNRNLIANFTQNTIQYNITTTANPTNGGTTSGGGIFTLNQSCSVHATPNTGYYFVNWTENSNIVSTDTNYTFTVTSNRNLTANFTQIIIQYNIITSPNPANGGVTSGGGIYNLNASCTVKATPNTGYVFVDWRENGNTVSVDTNYAFTVTANRNLVANFFLIPGIDSYSFNKSVNLFPNPAIEQTTLAYSQLNTNGQLQIYNILGQLVYEENITKGSSQLKLNTQNYKTGLYKVVLRENGIIKGQASLVKE